MKRARTTLSFTAPCIQYSPTRFYCQLVNLSTRRINLAGFFRTLVWRELQTARSTFWKLQFTLTGLQLEETKKKVLQKRQREAKLPQNNPVRCILLYFKCTPCSLGSVLAKTAQGTVFLNTLPSANIRNTPMTERFSKGGDFTFQKIYEIPCSPNSLYKVKT